MPEINVVHIAIIAAMTVVGAVVSWILRGKRAAEEKAAVSAGWQDQVNAHRVEHNRLTDQNKALMEQISQYQASNKDAKNRARELSEAVQEAYARRDELQREIKDIRGNLEVAMSEREKLQSNISSRAGDDSIIKAKDARIKKLQIELENWQNRLPPLIENFRKKKEYAEQLETELDAARQHIAELEASPDPGQTRIEPVRDPDTLTDGRDASNDPDDGEAEDDAGDEFDDEFDGPQVEAATEEFDEDLEDQVNANDEDDEDAEDAEDDAEDDGDDEDVPINGARDPLQAIKGVGPAIEKTLNEMGIFSYQQIADMSEYDIDRIAKRLKGFRTRIYREDWIGQARDLRDQDPSD